MNTYENISRNNKFHFVVEFICGKLYASGNKLRSYEISWSYKIAIEREDIVNYVVE